MSIGSVTPPSVNLTLTPPKGFSGGDLKTSGETPVAVDVITESGLQAPRAQAESLSQAGVAAGSSKWTGTSSSKQRRERIIQNPSPLKGESLNFPDQALVERYFGNVDDLKQELTGEMVHDSTWHKGSTVYFFVKAASMDLSDLGYQTLSLISKEQKTRSPEEELALNDALHEFFFVNSPEAQEIIRNREKQSVDLDLTHINKPAKRYFVAGREVDSEGNFIEENNPLPTTAEDFDETQPYAMNASGLCYPFVNFVNHEEFETYMRPSEKHLEKLDESQLMSKLCDTEILKTILTKRVEILQRNQADWNKALEISKIKSGIRLPTTSNKRKVLGIGGTALTLGLAGTYFSGALNSASTTDPKVSLVKPSPVITIPPDQNTASIDAPRPQVLETPGRTIGADLAAKPATTVVDTLPVEKPAEIIPKEPLISPSKISLESLADQSFSFSEIRSPEFASKNPAHKALQVHLIDLLKNESADGKVVILPSDLASQILEFKKTSTNPTAKENLRYATAEYIARKIVMQVSPGFSRQEADKLYQEMHKAQLVIFENDSVQIAPLKHPVLLQKDGVKVLFVDPRTNLEF